MAGAGGLRHPLYRISGRKLSGSSFAGFVVERSGAFFYRSAIISLPHLPRLIHHIAAILTSVMRSDYEMIKEYGAV
jgi:hypothetical protein